MKRCNRPLARQVSIKFDSGPKRSSELSDSYQVELFSCEYHELCLTHFSSWIYMAMAQGSKTSCSSNHVPGEPVVINPNTSICKMCSCPLHVRIKSELSITITLARRVHRLFMDGLFGYFIPIHAKQIAAEENSDIVGMSSLRERCWNRTRLKGQKKTRTGHKRKLENQRESGRRLLV